MESLYDWPSRKRLFTSAPWLPERVRYLEHLTSLGFPKPYIQMRSTHLLAVLRYTGWDGLAPTTLQQISSAAEAYCKDCAQRKRPASAYTRARFINFAKGWYSFHGKLNEISSSPLFRNELKIFCEDQAVLGISEVTMRSRAHRVKQFLTWLAGEEQVFSEVSIHHLDRYLAEKATLTCRSSSIAATCNCLRVFFKSMQKKGLSQPIVEGMKAPSTPKYNIEIVGPTWDMVRTLIESSSQDGSVAGTRAYAIICLCAVYGLRAIEIARLNLDDFDWRAEILTVHRAKGGRIQRYPLQYEVGEAVIRYLRNGRPACSSRGLFISLQAPHRRVKSQVVSNIVAYRLKRLPGYKGRNGSHILRHACATHLLNQGSSLKSISEFLGHRDPRSVSIYAKYNTRSLGAIASFSLAGCL